MHSDPIADMLTRIRNAGRSRRKKVLMPFSALKLEIAEILKREGYVHAVREVGAQLAPKEHQLELILKYDEKGEPTVGDLQRMSRPGLRRHYSCDAIPKIRGGLGVVILTTSRGLMTDADARKARVGGEALCAVW